MIFYQLYWDNNGTFEDAVTEDCGIFSTVEKAKEAAQVDYQRRLDQVYKDSDARVEVTLVWDKDNQAGCPTAWDTEAHYGIDEVELDRLR